MQKYLKEWGRGLGLLWKCVVISLVLGLVFLPLNFVQKIVAESGDLSAVWRTLFYLGYGLIVIVFLPYLVARFATNIGLIEESEDRANQPLQGTPAKAPSSSTKSEGRRS